jgi:hypothetical protein
MISFTLGHEPREVRAWGASVGAAETTVAEATKRAKSDLGNSMLKFGFDAGIDGVH